MNGVALVGQKDRHRDSGYSAYDHVRFIVSNFPIGVPTVLDAADLGYARERRRESDWIGLCSGLHSNHNAHCSSLMTSCIACQMAESPPRLIRRHCRKPPPANGVPESYILTGQACLGRTAWLPCRCGLEL